MSKSLQQVQRSINNRRHTSKHHTFSVVESSPWYSPEVSISSRLKNCEASESRLMLVTSRPMAAILDLFYDLCGGWRTHREPNICTVFRLLYFRSFDMIISKKHENYLYQVLSFNSRGICLSVSLSVIFHVIMERRGISIKRVLGFLCPAAVNKSKWRPQVGLWRSKTSLFFLHLYI